MSKYYGYVSVDALMEFANNHVNGMIDSNDIARFPKADVKDANEQQSLQEIFGIPFDRLRELADAEREGRVVVLPCKVGTPVFFIRILCEHADDFGYCNVDYWYAKRGFKTEDGCVNCQKMNLKQRLKETVFKLALMDEKRTGHLHVSEIFFDRAEAERALAATEPKGDANT